MVSMLFFSNLVWPLVYTECCFFTIEILTNFCPLIKNTAKLGIQFFIATKELFGLTKKFNITMHLI